MAEEPEVQQEETPRKRSKLLLFLLLGLVMLLLAGGGFFAYTKFLAPPPEDASSESASAEARPQIGEIFSMEPFVVNLADPKGKRYLKVQIELELASPLALERTTQNSPKLRDNVIMMLTSLTFEEVMTPEGKIRLRDELLHRFNQVLRPDRVENIYFTEFVIQ